MRSFNCICLIGCFFSVGFSCGGLSLAADAEGKWDPIGVEDFLFSELKEENKDVVQRVFSQIHPYTFAVSFERNSRLQIKLILSNLTERTGILKKYAKLVIISFVIVDLIPLGVFFQFVAFTGICLCDCISCNVYSWFYLCGASLMLRVFSVGI